MAQPRVKNLFRRRHTELDDVALCSKSYLVRIMALSYKMPIFWVVAPYSLVEVYQSFSRADGGGSKDSLPRKPEIFLYVQFDR